MNSTTLNLQAPDIPGDGPAEAPAGVCGGPIAARRPHIHVAHARVRRDDWHWLSEGGAEVEALIDAENAHTERWLDAQYHDTGAASERSRIAGELERRANGSLSAPAARVGDYEYTTFHSDDQPYPKHRRRRVGTTRWRTYLDENLEAGAGDSYSLGMHDISPDGRWVAWSADRDGSERYSVSVRNIATGATFTLAAVAGNCLAWSADSASLCWIGLDPLGRYATLWRGWIDEAPVCLHTQTDPTRDLHVSADPAGAHVMVCDESWSTGDMLALEAGSDELVVVAGGEPNTTCDAAYHPGDGGLWYVLSCPVDRPATVTVRHAHTRRGEPHTVCVGDAGTAIEEIHVFSRYLVCMERHLVQPRLRVIELGADGMPTGITRLIAAFDVGDGVWLANRRSWTTRHITLGIEGPLTAPTHVSVDLASGQYRILGRERPALDVKADRYVRERIWVRAADGTELPVTLVRRADIALDGSAKCVMYVYGAYGESYEAIYWPARVAMLERGVICAFAHVRGGSEFGEPWHNAARGADKLTSMTDSFSVLAALISRGYTHTGGVALWVGSAGGYVGGWLANVAGDLLAGVIFDVPVLDAISTLSRDDLPLVGTDRVEYGNPATDPAAYESICTWSPYDNIGSQPYPPVYLRTGRNDSRAMAWESLKYAQRLRATRTDAGPTLVRVSNGGHDGPTATAAGLDRDVELVLFLAHVLDVDLRPLGPAGGRR